VNIKGGIAAVITRVPRIILGLRSLPPNHYASHKPYMRKIYLWLAQQTNVQLVSNSKVCAKAYEKWLGLPSNTVSVLHNGFDFAQAVMGSATHDRKGYRASRNLPEAIPIVGTVIRLSEEKQPLLWLEIAKLVHNKIPEAQFLIVGDGPMKAKMVQFLKQHDLQNCVHLVGYEKAPMTAISAMDLFLLSSRIEGLPNVLVEAQAMGIPVVTTPAGGATEAVAHGLTGWILQNNDVVQAANTIVETLQNHEWRSKAAKLGPQFVQKHFGLKRMIQETCVMYGVI